MIATVINRARNLSIPVETDGNLIHALWDALKHSGEHEIQNGQVEIICDKDFAKAAARVRVPMGHLGEDEEPNEVAPFAFKGAGSFFAYFHNYVPVLVQ